jgi:hypothetical protein
VATGTKIKVKAHTESGASQEINHLSTKQGDRFVFIAFSKWRILLCTNARSIECSNSARTICKVVAVQGEEHP